METKVCSMCKNEKTLTSEYFYKRKQSKDGFEAFCKECRKLRGKDHYQKNKEQIQSKHREYSRQNKEAATERSKRWRTENREKYDEYQQKYRQENKEFAYDSIKKWKNENKEHISTQSKEYYQRTKDHVRKRNLKRRHNDHIYRLSQNSRNRLYCVLKGYLKSDKTFNLIGCSKEELKLHLESQFKEGMTWENYGVYGWHVDHITPCASFDLTDPEQQKQCFHYTNLQPLWAKENLSKGSKIKRVSYLP